MRRFRRARARRQLSAEDLFGHEGAPQRIRVPESNQAAAEIVGADRARSGLWKYAHRTPLPDHRLLLDVELHPLHVRQYDFGWKQSISNLLGGGLRLNLHRFLDCQRAVRGAHEAPEVAAHTQPPAKVSCDGAEVGPTPTADLDARHCVLTWREVENTGFVDLDLTCGRFGLFSLPREPV